MTQMTVADADVAQAVAGPEPDARDRRVAEFYRRLKPYLEVAREARHLIGLGALKLPGDRFERFGPVVRDHHVLHEFAEPLPRGIFLPIGARGCAVALVSQG